MQGYTEEQKSADMAIVDAYDAARAANIPSTPEEYKVYWASYVRLHPDVWGAGGTVEQSAARLAGNVEELADFAEGKKMTAAHEQRTTLHIIECVPAHLAREDDPHYAIFNQVHARLKRQGLLKCWIDNADCAGEIELHHDKVEFSLQNGVDLTRFEEAFPEFAGKSDEEFKAWIEGEGNLLPLCRLHHIGIMGVHVIPYPLWLPQKFWKQGMIAPAHVETQSELTVIGGAANVRNTQK